METISHQKSTAITFKEYCEVLQEPTQEQTDRVLRLLKTLDSEILSLDKSEDGLVIEEQE